MTEQTNPMRTLPQVEETLRHPALEEVRRAVPHAVVVQAVQDAIEQARQAIRSGQLTEADASEIARNAALQATALVKPSLRRVVNASGVIVHTNLGRSVLAPEAIDAVNQVMLGYSTLEYDTHAMARGSRHDHCEPLICALTGAEAAIAVNNNAAAVMMVLSEFAAGREAVISRGELVEIGGSFRIPDIMALSHARTVEVGTTNKTHASDYERALSPDTALLLKVHPSNYRMIGFTESVSLEKLKELANKHAAAGNERPLVYEDQGSGAFIALDAFDACAEPTVAASLSAGADLVSFSGDKLLGGPQAGIIVGRKDLIARLKANPLARALRLDKMTIAALEATLRLYLHPEEALGKIPTLRMLTENADEVGKRAHKLDKLIARLVDRQEARVSVVAETSCAGGGALPMCDIPTYVVKVEFDRGNAQSCARYLAQECPIPIIARLAHEALLFDARTLTGVEELKLVAAGIASYFETLDR